MKRLALPSVLLIAGAALTACGGAPTDASTSDFCDAQTSLLGDLSAASEDVSDEEAVKKAKEWAGELEEVGTPEGISEDARKGFELMVDEIKGLPDDATEEDVQKVEDDFSGDEDKQVKAYGDYVNEECAAAMEKQMEEQMGDLDQEMQDQLDQSQEELDQQLEELEEQMESGTSAP